MESLQDRFEFLGLDTPVKRGVVGGSLGYILVTAARPGFSYNEDGSARPWAILSPEAEDATAIPWFFFPAVGAAGMALFV